MRLDTTLAMETARLGDVAATARAAEALGLDGVWASETQHSPFLALGLAAQATGRIQLGTSVAIAFARSPMVVAQEAWDLQALSGGRFALGLGTQVKAHIERRFGMPWGRPVARLREYILALRAIWANWQDGSPLRFAGEFYNHTLMTPFFSPGPIAHPRIPIAIAGVNEGLAQLAGELCDGFHAHPFHTRAYLDQVIRPQIAAGAARAGRAPAAIELMSAAFVVTGADDAAMEAAAQQVREQIAFYASTPSYQPVLALHGWEDVGERLGRLASARQWGEMGGLIGDAMLDELAVVAPLGQVGAALRERYAGVLDRVTPYIPYAPGAGDALWRELLAALRS
ncbi:TIGR03617 family F420-dependent LLM class oxidoreductase [Chloroflexia bacterium SDU3-3]|nr:TIGR03617 family F420-dependent LLM class oxidoreductase [Chloroflexia bacterium SDU3-3]